MADSAQAEELLVRLYCDQHIKKQLAVDLKERGFDVLLSDDAGRGMASDEEQLEFATKENRSILTFNIRDFAPLHAQWLAAGRDHAGIIVSQQLGSRHYGLLLARMFRLLNHFSADQMCNKLVHLEQFK